LENGKVEVVDLGGIDEAQALESKVAEAEGPYRTGGDYKR
jgi:hypothetical protein